LFPANLIVVTIALAVLALFVAALIVRHKLSSFIVARRRGCVIVNTLLPAMACL
jgi:hypothetical protein